MVVSSELCLAYPTKTRPPSNHLLRTGKEKSTLFSAVSLSFVGLVVAVNIGRFLLWGWMHKRIDLSKSYPLTAMFFPLVALLSVFSGETIDPIQWFGITLITVGVVWFSVFVKDNQKDASS